MACILFCFLVFLVVSALLTFHSAVSIVMFLVAARQEQSTLIDVEGGSNSSDDAAEGSRHKGYDSSGDGTGMPPLEFEHLEGMPPVEARPSLTSHVYDLTASGNDDMLLPDEAAKTVGGRGH